MIQSEIWRALGYLLVGGVITMVYEVANGSTKTRHKLLLHGLLWIVAIGIFASLTVGQPTCVDYETANSTNCLEYADDGFDPTTDQRIARFAYILILLYPPVVFAAFSEKH